MGFIMLAIVGLTLVLTFTGMQTLLELWQQSPRSHWLVPFLMTPIVAGICAGVCYLFYALFCDMSGDKGSSAHEL